MASSSTSPFSRARVMATLTTVQHTSALVFGSFLLVHLAAPSAAVVAPRGESVELATKTMILGRVYYQNVISEPVVVFASASLHLLASLAKRALQLKQSRSRSHQQAAADDLSEVQGYTIGDASADCSSSRPSPSTPWSISLHMLTGLVLFPAVAMHSYLNRFVPASSAKPINELSPSELDYSYVTHGFLTPRKAWRYITWTLYTLLLCAGAVHVVGGTDRIAKRARAKRAGKEMKKKAALPPLDSNRARMRAADVRRKWQRTAVMNGAVSLAGVAWLALGLRRMAMEESGHAQGWMAKRLDACYASVWPYSLIK